MWPGPYGQWGSRKYVLASLDQTLKRMGVDYVDIFYTHRFDADTPLKRLPARSRPGSVRAGPRTRASPPIRERTAEAAANLRGLGTPLLIHQPSYKMLNRWIEGGLLDASKAEGAGSIAFSPLAQGLLTTKYLNGVPAGSRASRNGSLSQEQLTDTDPRTRPGAERDRGRARAVAGADGDLLDATGSPGHLGPGRCEQRRPVAGEPRRGGQDHVHRRRDRRDRQERSRGRHQHLGRLQRALTAAPRARGVAAARLRAAPGGRRWRASAARRSPPRPLRGGYASPGYARGWGGTAGGRRAFAVCAATRFGHRSPAAAPPLLAVISVDGGRRRRWIIVYTRVYTMIHHRALLAAASPVLAAASPCSRRLRRFLLLSRWGGLLSGGDDGLREVEQAGRVVGPLDLLQPRRNSGRSRPAAQLVGPGRCSSGRPGRGVGPHRVPGGGEPGCRLLTSAAPRRRSSGVYWVVDRSSGGRRRSRGRHAVDRAAEGVEGDPPTPPEGPRQGLAALDAAQQGADPGVGQRRGQVVRRGEGDGG